MSIRPPRAQFTSQVLYAARMAPTSRLQSSEFKDLITRTRGTGSFENAWAGYRTLILELARQTQGMRLLEIGGGRDPLLSQTDVAELECEYTVNDIDAKELALAPAWVKKLHGDIADPKLFGTMKYAGMYDLVFSHMVFEHVEHPELGYRNIARLLAPGGILINFVPTLYSAPFVLNRLLPERLSARILEFVFPDRNLSEFPKFPAYYRWCTTTKRTRNRLDDVGFRDVEITPFYGHDYYAKIPVLRTLGRRSWPLAERHGWRMLSTYAYIFAEG